MNRNGRPTFDPPVAKDTPRVIDRPDRACNGADTELFYPKQGERPRDALKLCMRCPCRRECLDWALATRQTFGVWGGKTADERHEMLANRKRVA